MNLPVTFLPLYNSRGSTHIYKVAFFETFVNFIESIDKNPNLIKLRKSDKTLGLERAVDIVIRFNTNFKDFVLHIFLVLYINQSQGHGT